VPVVGITPVLKNTDVTPAGNVAPEISTIAPVVGSVIVEFGVVVGVI